MEDIFLALILWSIVGLIIGIIRPKFILRKKSVLLEKIGYRKAASGIFLFLIILFFILFGITNKSTDTQSKIQKTALPPTTSTPSTVANTPPTQPATPAQSVIFDVPALFGKTLTQLKSVIGQPTRYGAPTDYPPENIGWAEWDKDALTFSVNFDNNYRPVDTSVGMGCAMAIFPKQGYWEANKLKRAGNLTGSNYSFVIQPMRNKDGILYGFEFCNKE